ncbi:flagellar biosynthetic protein FliO [Dyella sp.]|jgi:flagellar protein FliO/FliZ|uniref:flagellar biosynthetic protein FliO n=1 Tax=Dyella sp. TaxID=1869338 RepID=UPI002D79AEB5|nr:flagellar biosynthetic protein FliO [Dyella sp.]HET6431130.1 flagellar biosynthetic protein FliO [Dyella sp.]
MLTVLALAAPAAAAAPEINVGAELVRVVLSLAGIIALIFAAGWLSKRLAGRATPGGRRIRCVETLAIGARDRVLLIEANGKRLLVGVGQGGMRTLHVYNGEIDTAHDAPPPAAPVPAFGELLARWKRTP